MLCRHYVPSPMQDAITVPILPVSMRHQALTRNHDTPTAGHQAYWVSMAKDVERHCRQCTKCQQSKLPMPPRTPLTNVPIGRPWEMIVDILEVPMSSNNNRYLLVVQDYEVGRSYSASGSDSNSNLSRTCKVVL